MSAFDGPGDDPDLARFDPLALAESLRGGLGAGSEIAAQLADIRGRAESPDGTVRVEVDQQGRVTDVHLEPKAMRLPSSDLGPLVVRLSREAGSDAARQITAVVGDPSRLTAQLDPETISRRLADVTASFSRLSGMSRDQFEDLQRRLRP